MELVIFFYRLRNFDNSVYFLILILLPYPRLETESRGCPAHCPVTIASDLS